MSAPEFSKNIGHILVVGGCGFLGHHIVDMLVGRHSESTISVLDLRTNSNRNPSPQVSYHEGDITDECAMGALFAKLKPDIVIHTASPHAMAKDDVLYKVNVDGTKALLKAAQENAVKAFVYTSSASVVFNWDTGLINADERWPIIAGKKQKEYYTSTKAWAEVAVLEANRKPASFLTCAIRPAGIFGEGDVQTLPNIVVIGQRGSARYQLGPNENLFDFTYVKNIAHGHLLAANALVATHAMAPTVPLDSEKVDGEAFFITNDSPVYFWDFMRTVWKHAGVQIPMKKVWAFSPEFSLLVASLSEWYAWFKGQKPALTRERAKYSYMTRYYSVDKARLRLGYKPLVGLEEGIKRGVADVLETQKQEAEKKSQ
ncbi:3-beta hydroxysteroid dehydrogenase/isomerase family-domain-containing protein [Lineolata rhizophorae]|uniref:Sterol-4-alpha-carboxylate 3-dehydrogenase ERG26, decarboxylating n=1 Tax=Lineolata rhizophorae TaxID=578093 RepID=A0A6A6P8C0_9PEZI|nr:3-beta hydroxysteroid dehydrogenase/isomerase family-domain-containing protein [Lineolata rhizophorae]